jgi:predicted nucleic-acid-binding protein
VTVIGLDTNVVIRYLTRDDEVQFAHARRLIEEELSADNPGFITSITLAEIVWVLETNYSVNRAGLLKALEIILSSRQFVTEAPDTAWRTLRAFKATSGDYVDILIGELAQKAGCSATVTFDRRASTLPGFRLLA